MNTDSYVAYFAYGANMNLQHLCNLGVQVLRAERAILEGWRLCFNVVDREQLGSGFANILPSDGDRVEGVLYLIATVSIASLDTYEDYPQDYGKVWVKVQTWEGLTVECFVYVGRCDRLAEGLLPTDQYLQLLLTAQPFLSVEYYRELKHLQVLPSSKR